ncbi:MAG: tRNA (guanosine(37)-N1)-methyltransferase TrmD [Elusimicrobiota bacterium]
MRKIKPVIFDVVTLFPRMFEGPMTESIIRKAQKEGLIEVRVHNLRQWSIDSRHSKVDDRPFGGGAGMVIQAEPIYRAIKDLGGLKKKNKPWVVYLSPQGTRFSQDLGEKIAKKQHVLFICGHYEGIDERVMEFIDQEISIGDYILTGGELPVMVVIDAVSRFLPGVVGDPESVKNDSFANGLLDTAHYTRPGIWRGKAVPPVLLSGDHKKIAQWREKRAFEQTKKKRPDLLKNKILKKNNNSKISN